MKKIILSIAVAASAMALASCSGSSKEAAAAADSTATAETTEQVAELTEAEGAGVLDKIKEAASSENVQKGLDYVKSLISSGKIAEAKSYLEQLKPYADKVGLTSAYAAVATAVDKAESVAGNLGETAKAAGDSAVAAGKQKVNDAVSNATEKVSEKAADALGKIGLK